jgi:hypothetical protein
MEKILAFSVTGASPGTVDVAQWVLLNVDAVPTWWSG